MNKPNSPRQLRTESDTKLIATCLQCSYEQVHKIIKGERGKTGTPLQESIHRALAFRSQQNKNLEKFCNELKMDNTSPKAVQQA